jgi:hypothetical protein
LRNPCKDDPIADNFDVEGVTLGPTHCFKDVVREFKKEIFVFMFLQGYG